MKPIKVLYVVTSMNRGGIETMIMNHYRILNRESIKIDFLVHREERGAYDDEIEALGGVIYRLPPINIIPFTQYHKNVKQFFENHPEYEIVHAHINALSYFVLKYAKSNGVEVRIAHSHIAATSKGIKGIIKSYYKNKLRQECNYMFACGEKAGRYLFGNKNFDENRVKVINNAIDSEKYQYNEDIREKARQELNIENKFVIGHIARLTLQKNQIFLLEIFKKVVEIKSDSILIIVGSGEEEKNIREKIYELNLEQHVKLMGIQSDTNYFYQAMDVYLLPSLYEGLPVTLIEAQASGLISIVSDTIDREVDITNSVRVLSLDDSAAYWAQEIVKHDKYNREKVSELIKEKKYDVFENVSMLETFYKNCIDNMNEDGGNT